MRADTSSYASAHSVRSAFVYLFRGVRVYELGGASPAADLTEMATSISITEASAKVRLSFDRELFDCVVQPRPGDILQIVVDGVTRAAMFVDAITDFVESRGTRSMTVSCRTRDGFEGWRSTHATSPLFAQGTSYKYMMDAVCETVMNLDEEEHQFLPISLAVPHSNVQFSDQTPWDMLEEIALAAGMEPFADVLNILRTFRYDTLRTHDIAVENERVVEFGAGKLLTSSTTGSIRLSWLSPYLSKQYQTAQVLGNEIMTAGFFKLEVKKEVWFSDDHRQRAENTYLKVIDSVNNGLLGVKVASEDYKQHDQFHGEIVLRTYWWVPTLYTISLVTLLTYSYVPDLIEGVGIGVTTPWGRVIHGTALVAMLGITMSLGTGTYEIWGEPYDYVHAKNTTVVRACNLGFHQMSREDLETVLVVSEEHAQDMAVKLLSYRLAQNYEVRVTLIDDPRIEKGDILLFEDGSRVMVMGFGNDFSRGSKALINVSGILL